MDFSTNFQSYMIAQTKVSDHSYYYKCPPSDMTMPPDHLNTSYIMLLVTALSATPKLTRDTIHRSCLPACNLALLAKQLAHVHIAFTQAYFIAQLMRLFLLHVLRVDYPGHWSDAPGHRFGKETHIL